MLPVAGSVQLEAEDIRILERRLADCRHNVNNDLSAIVSALELVRFKPEESERLIETAIARVRSISAELGELGVEFEQALSGRESETSKS